MDDGIIESAPKKRDLTYRADGLKRHGFGCYYNGREYVASADWINANGFAWLFA